jgi:MFS family permease
MVLIYGIRHSFSVFFTPILSEFAWSRGSVALMLSLNILIYGFLAPFAGFFADRWRSRVIITVGALILALATAGCALASKLWHFYLLFGVLVPLGTAFCGWPIYAPTLMNWFHRRRGLVLGCAQMGGGLSMAYTILVGLAIENLGWRPSFVILAVTLIVVFLPLVFLFFHSHPGDKGLQPFGSDGPPVTARSPIDEVTLGVKSTGEKPLAVILSSPQLWLLVLSYALCWGIAHYMILAHQVRFLQDAGFSTLYSSSMLGLFGIMVCLGQATGFLSDWMGREKAMTLATSASFIGIGALLFIRDTSQPWLLYLFSICCGYGAGLVTPTIFAASADIFPGRHFGTVSGFLLGGMGVGSVLGPWFGGFLYDTCGSYAIAFLLCLASLIVSCLLVWAAAPRNSSSAALKRPPLP